MDYLVLFVSIVITLGFFTNLDKLLNKIDRKQFQKKYGTYIGKKGFVHPGSCYFFDENKKAVEELGQLIVSCSAPIDTFIPCELIDAGNYLKIRPEIINENFEVKYVGENTVLYNPQFEELVSLTEDFTTPPLIGQIVPCKLKCTRGNCFLDFHWSVSE